MGAVGCVLVPLVVLPGAELPVPARSCCMHESLSVPIMFAHRLSPPTAAGGATGAGETIGPGEGVTAGVCEGVTAGVCDGVTAGDCDGVIAGDWANAPPATARRIAALRVFNMAVPFIRFC